MGDHVGGDVTGERPLIGDGHGLRAVSDLELVGLDEHLHAAQRGERGKQDDLHPAEVEMGVTQLPCELLHEIRGLEMIEVHFPVARDQRNAFGRHGFLP